VAVSAESDADPIIPDFDATAPTRYPAAVPWEPTFEVWQYELLDKLPRSIDVTQIEESLRLTPTERLERMRRFMEFLEEVRRSGEHRLPRAD
jgi:hypothetical protein